MSRPINLAHILTAFALGITLPLLLAQSAPSAKPQTTQPQDADAELTRLRAENARLRAELEKAKADLATKTAASATTATKPRAFTTMQDILINTPAEIRPQATAEWYKYTGIKFDNWWKAQLAGMTFEQNLSYESAHVAHSINPSPGAEWDVSFITFATKSFTYFGADHSWHVYIPMQKVDEAAAKKWDTIKKGTLFKIKATIATIEFAPGVASDHAKLPVYHVVLYLRDVEFLPPSQ